MGKTVSFSHDDIHTTLSFSFDLPAKVTKKQDTVWPCPGCGAESKITRNEAQGGAPEIYGETPPPIVGVTKWNRLVKRQMENLRAVSDSIDCVATYFAYRDDLKVDMEIAPTMRASMEILHECRTCRRRVRALILHESELKMKPWTLDPLELEVMGFDMENLRTRQAFGRLYEEYGPAEKILAYVERLKDQIARADEGTSHILPAILAVADEFSYAAGALTPLVKVAKIVVAEGRVRELLEYRLRALLYKIYAGAVRPPRSIAPDLWGPPTWMKHEPGELAQTLMSTEAAIIDQYMAGKIDEARLKRSLKQIRGRAVIDPRELRMRRGR